MDYQVFLLRRIKERYDRTGSTTDALVDRVDLEDSGLAVRRRVDLPDQAVAVDDRQRVVAPAALGRRLVHLERVLEVEQLLGAAAVVDEPVERRQERRAP